MYTCVDNCVISSGKSNKAKEFPMRWINMETSFRSCGCCCYFFCRLKLKRLHELRMKVGKRKLKNERQRERERSC